MRDDPVHCYLLHAPHDGTLECVCAHSRRQHSRCTHYRRALWRDIRRTELSLQSVPQVSRHLASSSSAHKLATCMLFRTSAYSLADTYTSLPRHAVVADIAGEVWYSASVLAALMMFGLAGFLVIFGALPYWFKLHRHLITTNRNYIPPVLLFILVEPWRTRVCLK